MNAERLEIVPRRTEVCNRRIFGLHAMVDGTALHDLIRFSERGDDTSLREMM